MKQSPLTPSASQYDDLLEIIPDGYSIVDHLPQFVYRIDLDGQLLYANQTLLNHLNQTLEDLAGKTAYDFYPRQLANKYRQDDMMVVQSKKTFHEIEVNIDPVSGKKSYVELYKVPIFNDNGDVEGIQGVFWDISERFNAQKQQQENEMLFRTMADLSPDAIMLVDENLIVHYMNRTMCGMDKASCIGSYMPDLMPNDSEQITKVLRGTLLSGENGRFETQLQHTNGSLLFIETLVSKMVLGRDKIRLQLCSRDISHYKNNIAPA